MEFIESVKRRTLRQSLEISEWEESKRSSSVKNITHDLFTDDVEILSSRYFAEKSKHLKLSNYCLNSNENEEEFETFEAKTEILHWDDLQSEIPKNDGFHHLNPKVIFIIKWVIWISIYFW